MDKSRSTFESLRHELAGQLVPSENVTPPPGVATGWSELDRFLLWHGFPKAAVSLMISESSGATTLWSRSARELTQKNQWVAWINSTNSSLNPWNLRQRGVNLSRLLNISAPVSPKQTLWALQELMSLNLFELIGCDLGHTTLREHQVLQLKKLALRYQTAVVLFTENVTAIKSSFYALVTQFSFEHVIVHRALHRPTPHLLQRRDLYADTLPQLTAGRRALCG